MNLLTRKRASRLALGVVPLALLACSTSQVDKTPRKPNIMIILADDAGYNDFGFMGSTQMKTPHIDSLAEEGVRFTDAHVTSTVCSPSRAGIMSGRYQQRFGHECNGLRKLDGMDTTETTLARALKENGYTTAAFGKWHLGSAPKFHPNKRGFDYFYGFLAGSRHYFPDKNDDRPGDEHAIQENGTYKKFNGYLTDILGDKAIGFIRKNQKKPFFIYLAYNAVHTPMQAPEADLRRFAGNPRQMLAAMTWALDRSVGNVLNELKQDGLLDNTLIFFLSDNGGPTPHNTSSNYPLKGFKGNEYEGGERVPFVVYWGNRIQGGREFNGLVSSLDIFSTALDAAGVKHTPGKPLDGTSLLPYLSEGEKGNPHPELFWRKDKDGAVREGSYKLIHVNRLGYRLYDLKNDLGETHDLQYSDTLQFDKMKRALQNWEKSMKKPLWTEGAVWDTITLMIHDDLFHNRPVRVTRPSELRKWKMEQEKQKE